MSKIKKYFIKKKEEAAFKLKIGGASLGQGHSLNAPAQPSGSQKKSPNTYVPPKRKELSNEARAAAAAALSRIETKDSKEFNTSLAAIKAQAKRELEAERRQREEEAKAVDSSTASSETKINTNLACQGVFFRCPMINEEVLPKKEWKVKIKEFLYQQLEGEKALTASLIIQNCNPREKADDCIQTLTKYLDNIINHPNEEKYLKIRMSNRIFSDKVRYVEGAFDFLLGAGFREVELDGEPFLIWSQENLEEGQDLPALLEALKNAEPISLELDRNIRVLLPSQARRVQLPDDFYRISPEEIKREQQLRSEALESAQVLKTKAMREREEQRTLRMYRYALVRVKFPNGIYIQGTFNVYEKISDIYEFVQSCLMDESLEFSLVSTADGKFTEEDMDKTLYDLRLIPNVVLLFVLPSQMSTVTNDADFLKQELLLLVQSM